MRALAGASAAAMLAAACVVASPDEQLLSEFFSSSRALDLARVADIATVAIDPRRDGVVGDFAIVAASAPEDRPLGGETPLAALSLAPAGLPDAAALPPATRIESRRLDVRATVRSAEGRTASEPLRLTLARATADRRVGRWIVTAVEFPSRQKKAGEG